MRYRGTVLMLILGGLGLSGGWCSGQWAPFNEPFDDPLATSGWQVLLAGTAETSSNPGYATITGDTTTSGYYLVRQAYPFAGGTQEWDLEVRLLPDNWAHPAGSGPLQSIQLSDSLSGDRYLTFGFYYDRFGIADGVVAGSNNSDLVTPNGTTTDLLAIFGATYELLGVTDPTAITEVYLSLRKRNTTAEQQADGGRTYCYVKMTADDGVNPLVTSEWIYLGYQVNANSYSGTLLVDMYGDAMGEAGSGGAAVRYDYINNTVATLPVALDFPNFDEDFDVVPLNVLWEPVGGAACDTSTHPGFATLTDTMQRTSGGDVFVNRWWYGYGGTAEWDLEVRLLPIQINENPADGPYQGLYLSNLTDSINCGYFLDRVGLPDGIIIGSTKTDLRIEGFPDQLQVVWRQSLSDAGFSSRVDDVILSLRKRYSTPEEIADNGRLYLYYQVTIDPNDGVNQPYTTDWTYHCHKVNANWAVDYDEDGEVDDLLISLFSTTLGDGQVQYDYFKMRAPGVPVLPAYCGDVHTVYEPMDFDRDCEVGLTDLAAFLAEWLHCTDPTDSRCDPFWTP